MKELWETYLPQFEACVREGKVEAVMGAYNRTNGEPCCAHSYLMVEVLRKQWDFRDIMFQTAGLSVIFMNTIR